MSGLIDYMFYRNTVLNNVHVRCTVAYANESAYTVSYTSTEVHSYYNLLHQLPLTITNVV